MDRATGFYPVGWGFESLRAHLSKALQRNDFRFQCRNLSRLVLRFGPFSGPFFLDQQLSHPLPTGIGLWLSRTALAESMASNTFTHSVIYGLGAGYAIGCGSAA